jgi:hypothetical protein
MHRAPAKQQSYLRAWFSGRASPEENFGISFSGYSLCIRSLLNQGTFRQRDCLLGQCRQATCPGPAPTLQSPEGPQSVRRASPHAPPALEEIVMKRPNVHSPKHAFPLLTGSMPANLKSAEQLGRRVTDAQSEVLGFMGRRLDANARTLQAFATCGTWEDLFAVQQAWLETIRADYANEADRMTRINRAILESLSDAPAAAERPDGGPDGGQGGGKDVAK